MQKIEIIHEPNESEPFLVIKKLRNVHSAPLDETDQENALSIAKKLYPEIENVKGRKAIEYGLLHRLDFETEGLMLIALTQEFYDFILNEQSEGRFIKSYTAYSENIPDNAEKLEGFPAAERFSDKKTIEVSSYFRNYGLKNKLVRPVTEQSGKAALKKLGSKKLYTTEISLVDEAQLKFTCKIKAGYRHQVRCHLSWIGFPVLNDELYNSTKQQNPGNLQFYANGLEFKNPITDKIMIYKLDY